MSEAETDIDKHLEALDAKETEFTHACLYRSSSRVAQEIRRTARAERRAIPYIYATFTIMNQAGSLLAPESGRDAAVEMIGLLESEDRARAIQPDLPEADYQRTVNHLSSCAYDNLATATAEMAGFNSDGMHACISEGMNVCRRTGKLQCLTCFREYACDVHRAADDLDMAMHFARAGIAHEKPGPHDRRWASARDLTQLLLLSGQVQAAAETAEQTWELVPTWHNKISAAQNTSLLLREVGELLGKVDRADPRLGFVEHEDLKPLAVGEYPWMEMRRDEVDALSATCRGDHARAIELLMPWDKRLLRDRNLREWLEVRLRILAALRAMGNTAEFERMAAQLEAKARPARDWLSLRRLERLRDASASPSPLAAVDTLDTGLFAPRAAASTAVSADVASAATDGAASDAATAAGEASQAAEPAADEPSDMVKEFAGRIGEVNQTEYQDDAERAAALNAICNDLLAIKPTDVPRQLDIRWLLHLTRFTLTEAADFNAMWDWAAGLAKAQVGDATSLNLWASLGSTFLFGFENATFDRADPERLEKMFRESIDLDVQGPRNFERAGDFFDAVGQTAEAERCYARGFRLDRTNPNLADKLARIYRQTDRERDALAVLDMAIREGGPDPQLLWDAGLLAHAIERYDATLTYLDALDQAIPNRPWTHYYRGAALLALDRADEALSAAEKELENNPECPFPSTVHRTAALGKQGRTEEFRTGLRELLDVRLAEVDYLSRQGIGALMRLLWNVMAGTLGEDDALRTAWRDRMIAIGLAPDEIFRAEHLKGEPIEGIGFYVCTIRQPLDEGWNDSLLRLAWEADWKGFDVNWGVLARSEDEAKQIVLARQQGLFPLPAELRELRLNDDGYTDRVGIVWQGFREEAVES
jgi:tetratricopeptide (TPR) repeat protein